MILRKIYLNDSGEVKEQQLAERTHIDVLASPVEGGRISIPLAGRADAHWEGRLRLDLTIQEARDLAARLENGIDDALSKVETANRILRATEKQVEQKVGAA